MKHCLASIRQEFQAKRMKNLTKVFSKCSKAVSIQYIFYFKQAYSTTPINVNINVSKIGLFLIETSFIKEVFKIT